VIHCRFSHNTAFTTEAPFGGGAVYIGGGSLTATDCTFSENGGDHGGAISIGDSSEVTIKSSLIATNCEFSGAIRKTRDEGQCGGAIYADLQFTNSTAALINCSFSNNTADEGGAIYLKGGSLVATDCGFYDDAQPYGSPGEGAGAIYLFGGSLNATGCIFSDNNFSDGRGGGTIFVDSSTATLAGCKFVLPTPGASSAGHNDVYKRDDSAVTFACPPGTSGSPVKMKGAALSAEQLPPTTQIVHCS
jgi:predicted outer membrane repeat protein